MNGPPCPVCGKPWPWLYHRDGHTGKLVGCNHNIVFVTPDERPRIVVVLPTKV